MKLRGGLGAVALAVVLVESTACATYNPQRVDNPADAACTAQMQRAIEQSMIGNGETPQVARTLAVSATDQMAQEIPDQPRPNSHLAADLRVLKTDAKVGSSSGAVYYIYADQVQSRCAIHLTSNGFDIGSPVPIPACRCEPSQD